MLRRLLVPLDGEMLAEAAVPVALRLARLAGAEVRLVHVHQPELAAIAVSDTAVLRSEGEQRRRVRELGYLGEVAERFNGGKEVRITTQVIDGERGPALAGEIDSWNPDLVVCATHAPGPIGRFLLGSVADYLLRHASKPLLLLKPKDGLDWAASDRQIRSILVAWDLSPLGEAILGPVADIAALVGAKVELIHVLQPVVSVPVDAIPLSVNPELVTLQTEAAERQLNRLADRLRARNIRVQTRVVFGTTIPTTVMDVTEREGHDLIGITTHGRGGLTRALMGSVADKLVRASDVPVLVIRPD